jgi:hypothetical protein
MPNGPESKLEHFKIWLVAEKEFRREVKLLGQFDEERRKTEHLENLVWLANPVKKERKVENEKSHLVGYNLAQPEKPGPERWVILTNQFHQAKERTKWTLGDAAVLLVPASKVAKGEPPPPTDIDHFECYVVKGPKAFDRAVRLEDQIDKKRDRVEEIKKLEPAFFCVPVSKDGGKIVHPDVHLALYDLEPRVKLKEPLNYTTRDQFRTFELRVLESVMLAVPSQKLDWGPRKGRP